MLTLSWFLVIELSMHSAWVTRNTFQLTLQGLIQRGAIGWLANHLHLLLCIQYYGRWSAVASQPPTIHHHSIVLTATHLVSFLDQPLHWSGLDSEMPSKRSYCKWIMPHSARLFGAITKLLTYYIYKYNYDGTSGTRHLNLARDSVNFQGGWMTNSQLNFELTLL